MLYLDGDANINVVSSDRGESASAGAWKTAKPDALRGGHRDTDIVCLNMATSRYSAARAGVGRDKVLFSEGGMGGRGEVGCGNRGVGGYWGRADALILFMCQFLEFLLYGQY